MNEKLIYAILMWASAALAVIAGGATVVLLVLTVTQGLHLILPTFLLALVTVGAGLGGVFYGQRVEGHEKVFSNPIEQEVLSNSQRRELRRKRGELVMQRCLIEIENERDNIVHRQIEAASDPDKPPHKTRFGDDDDLPPRRRPTEFGH
jgi:hypothetical protein